MLAYVQGDVCMRRIRVHTENVPLLAVTHAEPQLDNVSVTATRCDGGRNRAAAIDHEEITRVKKAAQFGEAGVPDRLGRPVDDHQTHAITAQPTELGREVGAKLRR